MATSKFVGPPMRLEAWLTEQQKTPTELANELRVDVSTITRLIPEAGKKQIRRPGWDLIAKIKAATGGKVTADDFMADEALDRAEPPEAA
jgi:hypothetical protein